jgi:hypothetical protein
MDMGETETEGKVVGSEGFYFSNEGHQKMENVKYHLHRAYAHVRDFHVLGTLAGENGGEHRYAMKMVPTRGHGDDG